MPLYTGRTFMGNHREPSDSGEGGRSPGLGFLPSCRFREGSLSDLGQDLSLGGQRDMRPLTSLFLRA